MRGMWQLLASEDTDDRDEVTRHNAGDESPVASSPTIFIPTPTNSPNTSIYRETATPRLHLPVADDTSNSNRASWTMRMLVASVLLNAFLALLCAGLGLQLSATAWAVLLGIPTAFVLAFANGANDCANSVGTVVGAEAMSMQKALLAGSLLELVGALTIGPWVAKSIAGGVMHVDHFETSPTVFSLMMVSVLLGSSITTLVATVYGYPISATHGVISGLVAVGVVGGPPGAVNWGGVAFCVMGWVASPLVGLVAGAGVSWCVHVLVIAAQDPVAAAKQRQPALFCATGSIVLLFLLLKGPEYMQVLPPWLAALSALGGGVLMAVILTGIQHLQEQRTELANGVMMEMEEPHLTAAVKEFDEVQKPFVPLLIMAGLTVAFAHGGNDVGNAIGPLVVIVGIYNSHVVSDSPELPFWTLFFGGGAFVLGILSLGHRTITTVGCKITELTPSRSFVTQIGAAIAVLGSSVVSLPVSTSHCLVGSIIGISLAEKINGIPDAALDLSVLKKIVIGWAVTIPFAAAVAVVSFLLLKVTLIH